MVNRLAILIISCFLFSPLKGQELEPELLNATEINSEIMSTDKLRNCYVVNERDELIKFDKNGKKLSTFSNNRLGRVTSIDTYNPLKLLVHYAGFNLVVGLDNTLTEVARFDLNTKGLFVVPAICLSHDNHIWVFDTQTFRLKKIDDQLNVVLESDELTSILKGEIAPTQMLERQNHLFLNNPESGILMFDIYGTYIKTLPLINVEMQQVVNEQLIYLENGEAMVYDLKSLSTRKLGTPVDNPRAVQLQKERMYILTEEGLKIYSL